jgi:hypothetical protein
MIDQESLENWLTLVNARYRQEEIPPGHRPFKALSDFAKEFNCSFMLLSPDLKPNQFTQSIFDWFAANSKPGSQTLEPLFTGAFYFDSCFWPLNIPKAWGTVGLNPLVSLEEMPQNLKDQTIKSNADYLSLCLYWINCIDYAYGIDSILKESKLQSTTLTFLQNGQRELIGAVAQLLIPRPNTKAILALRMATETFMKALLIQENNLTDKALKKNYGHKLEDIAKGCFSTTGLSEFNMVYENASIFPDVSDRYDGKESQLSDVWKAICITQIAATSVIRWYTGRDTRNQFSSDPISSWAIRAI